MNAPRLFLHSHGRIGSSSRTQPTLLPSGYRLSRGELRIVRGIPDIVPRPAMLDEPVVYLPAFEEDHADSPAVAIGVDARHLDHPLVDEFAQGLAGSLPLWLPSLRRVDSVKPDLHLLLLGSAGQDRKGIAVPDLDDLALKSAGNAPSCSPAW